MSVKIFIPSELFYIKENCNIYGEVKINENNAVSYFIIAGIPSNSDSPSNEAFAGFANICGHLRHLGHIQRAGTQLKLSDVSLSFAYDNNVSSHIYLVKLNIKSTNVNTFLYDPAKVLKLYLPNQSIPNKKCDDVHMLYDLLEANKNSRAKYEEQLYGIKTEKLFGKALNFPLELMTRTFAIVMEFPLVKRTLKNIEFYKHYEECKLFQKSGKKNVNLTVDRILGICGMLLLLFFIPQPEIYLTRASQFIIYFVRLILRNLKGNPIGFKLNTHLNNFLLDFFNYHIDLWALFLELIEPFVHQLFVLTALFGSMGLSYQLALLADLISIIGLHAHCFYVYTAVLYKVEVHGLQVLWKVVRGKRYNILKKRVESHNYNNRQLYLSTIFFTSLFFLFPTVIVYYGVFTFVRVLIFLENHILLLLRRYILKFPLVELCNWLSVGFFEIEGIQLEHVNHIPYAQDQSLNQELSMSVFKLDVRSSSLGRVLSIESGVLEKLAINEHNIFKIIFNGILRGKLELS